MIQVRAPGIFTTVQDLGREGHGALGVSPSGAADPVALRIGNALVGNPPNAAALEITLLGPTLQFDQDCWTALSGSDFGVTPYTPRLIHAGETLRLGPTQSGARGYICMQGGIEVPLFLGSASTHILSGLGGFEGRALRKGDTLRVGEPNARFTPRRINVAALSRLAPGKTLRVTRSTQWDLFTSESKQAFFNAAYRVTEESNRMGLRLEGAPLESTSKGQMITEGVPLGAIQIPASGQPIILFVEQQTTGGYPKIANVIAADLASVGQLRPRDEIRFELVGMETARALIWEQEALLASEDVWLP